MVPRDRLLAELLIRHKDWIVTYHEHDSLLQSETETDLTEEERQAAWAEYENEKEGRANAAFGDSTSPVNDFGKAYSLSRFVVPFCLIVMQGDTATHVSIWKLGNQPIINQITIISNKFLVNKLKR